MPFWWNEVDLNVSQTPNITHSGALPGCHLSDLWPLRQRGVCSEGWWLTGLRMNACVCLLALQVGGVCACSVEGSDSNPNQHKLSACSRFPLPALCLCVCVCVPSLSIEEQWSTQCLQMPHKTLFLFLFSLFFWPFLEFLNCPVSSFKLFLWWTAWTDPTSPKQLYPKDVGSVSGQPAPQTLCPCFCLIFSHQQHFKEHSNSLLQCVTLVLMNALVSYFNQSCYNMYSKMLKCS